MKTLFVSLILVLVIAISTNGIAQEPEMKSQLVIKAGFGLLPDQYGFDGIENNRQGEYQLVSCFEVTAEGIYVFDRVKNDIKCYSLEGVYLKTIPAEWKSGRITAIDMVVQNNRFYLLVDFPVAPQDPDIEYTRFQLFTYDLEGRLLSRDLIPVPDLGMASLTARSDSPKAYARNSVKLTASDGSVSVLDRETQTSYQLIDKGKKVSALQLLAPVSGQPLDQNRLSLNRDRGLVEILNQSGNVVKTMPRGCCVVAKASDSGYFALKSRNKSAGKSRFEVAVYDANGDKLAFFPSPYRKWTPFFPTFQFYKQLNTNVYELHVGKNGVCVYRWSL